MKTMVARVNPISKFLAISTIALTILICGTSAATSDPAITITGNDNNYVWGTVQDLVFPLHYEILVYAKSADGRWYGPKNSVNDTFPGITPDMKWKCLYNTDYQGSSDTAFRAYIVEKGVTTDQVLINGAENLTLYYAQVVAETEGKKV